MRKITILKVTTFTTGRASLFLLLFPLKISISLVFLLLLVKVIQSSFVLILTTIIHQHNSGVQSCDENGIFSNEKANPKYRL